VSQEKLLRSPATAAVDTGIFAGIAERAQPVIARSPPPRSEGRARTNCYRPDGTSC